MDYEEEEHFSQEYIHTELSPGTEEKGHWIKCLP